MKDKWDAMSEGDALLLAYLSSVGVEVVNVTEAIRVVRRERPSVALPGLLTMLTDVNLNWHARWMISLMFRGPWVGRWAHHLLDAFKVNAMDGEAQVCGAIGHSLESVAHRLPASVVFSVVSDLALPDGFGAALIPVLARARGCSPALLREAAVDECRLKAVRRELARFDRRVTLLAELATENAPWAGEEWVSSGVSDEGFQRIVDVLAGSRDASARRVAECLSALALAAGRAPVCSPRWLPLNGTTAVGIGVIDDEWRVMFVGPKATRLGRIIVAECREVWALGGA